jgi:hypothetical protein
MASCSCGSCAECSARSSSNRRSLVDDLTIEPCLAEVVLELQKALRWERFNSVHEGWAVILEELDELWDEVKAFPKNSTKPKMRVEAAQVAAMAIRFMMDLC